MSGASPANEVWDGKGVVVIRALVVVVVVVQISSFLKRLVAMRQPFVLTRSVVVWLSPYQTPFPSLNLSRNATNLYPEYMAHRVPQIFTEIDVWIRKRETSGANESDNYLIHRPYHPHHLFHLLDVRYGVEGAVRQRFESLARLAFEHGMRVNELAACDVPKPQLVYFKDPNKVYLPRATLLHRCSDLTGCCPHSTHTCMALETKTVDLFFYTIVLKPNHLNPRKVSQMQNIDRITFANHTKCGCRMRSEYMPPPDTGYDLGLEYKHMYQSSPNLYNNYNNLTNYIN
ncbi:unnamed protein product [Oppiella nova]|uniref:Platelet-derived growth factor (PDGF) family profile domain-containing protein n=1 Tax=Oppiella nova TaxID=334625 RepID=A0A7R9LS15_9ACAR|nr:unnamed protein product [Oppiella nova]CAG2166380.1 unnamed protein product [Oppiella nova]